MQFVDTQDNCTLKSKWEWMEKSRVGGTCRPLLHMRHPGLTAEIFLQTYVTHGERWASRTLQTPPSPTRCSHCKKSPSPFFFSSLLCCHGNSCCRRRHSLACSRLNRSAGPICTLTQALESLRNYSIEALPGRREVGDGGDEGRAAAMAAAGVSLYS